MTTPILEREEDLAVISAATTSRTVRDFLPSTHGLHFANRFPSGPTIRFGPFDPRVIGIGDAAAGLCGGMSFTVRDLFEAEISPPPDLEPPANGSPRFGSLVRRQVESLDWLRLPLRFYNFMAFRPFAIRRSQAEASVKAQLPRIQAELDGGRLALIGVVRTSSNNPTQLVKNHQVIAYGYAEDGEGGGSLRIYDPNWPERDDVEFRYRPAADGSWTLEQSTGEPLFAFFLAPYSRRDPVAWR
jgi:hypothetical protein